MIPVNSPSKYDIQCDEIEHRLGIEVEPAQSKPTGRNFIYNNISITLSHTMQYGVHCHIRGVMYDRKSVPLGC